MFDITWFSASVFHTVIIPRLCTLQCMLTIPLSKMFLQSTEYRQIIGTSNGANLAMLNGPNTFEKQQISLGYIRIISSPKLLAWAIFTDQNCPLFVFYVVNFSWNNTYVGIGVKIRCILPLIWYESQLFQ